MTSLPLVFVHLSDIHFEATELGGPDDLNDDIRRHLLEDVAKQCATMAPPTGVLVCGDIAAKGEAVEYAYATDWLDQLCEDLGIGTERVWVIPGNHDVDQTAQRENRISELQRESLRSVALENLDDEIAKLHRDENLRQQMYAPLKNYNAFALAYNSSIEGGQSNRWWDAKFTMNDGSVLMVRGVNSTLVSDKTDQQRPQMVVGTAALMLPKEPGLTAVLMCHHPPTVLRDQATMDGPLAARASLQLFGHEHTQRVYRFRDSIRLFAGALHPERRGRDWKPHYYVIALRVDGLGDQRTLHVEVISRAWNNEIAAFAPDNAAPEGHSKFVLPLDPWTRRDLTAADSPATVETSEPEQMEAESSGSMPRVGGDEGSAMEKSSEIPLSDAAAARRLTHRFFRLPIPSQWKIVKDLGYIDLKDSTTTAASFFAAAFARAKEETKLAQLWQMVEHEHHSAAQETNPFEGR